MEREFMEPKIEQGLLSGELWEEYCDILKRAGHQLLRPETPRTAFDQAEGMRYLSRLIRGGLEMMVEAADPDLPVFIVPSHETLKIGGDNPDNLYMTARINGQHRYRLRGSRGTVPTLNFATKKGGFERAGSNLLGTGFLDGKDLQVMADGSFEIVIGPQQPASGNWLPTEAESHMLLVRQTFHDRRSEKPAVLSIERLDRVGEAPPLDPAQFSANLRSAALYVERVASLFCDWTRDFKTGHFNTLPLGDQAVFQAAGGDPNIVYYQGYWKLADDEAMIVDARVPECDFWNFQVNNYWQESLDYRYHRIHLNCKGAQYQPDGSVRIVVAHRDPGTPNWLTTAGHHEGTCLFRLIGAQGRLAELTTRVVKVDAVPQS
ncbi:conserved protein of unknown function [Denitratisoma oestradiolicum]|uniref:DUF1214 domain-containing protein n=2 Tax=Denitratisoma oestradiolicum TaxID=311182 RepID=A0A6S6XT59_9PROT|nr:conserved protein of unknown function [Denitratisoma oestradiolicum]